MKMATSPIRVKYNQPIPTAAIASHSIMATKVNMPPSTPTIKKTNSAKYRMTVPLARFWLFLASYR